MNLICSLLAIFGLACPFAQSVPTPRAACTLTWGGDSLTGAQTSTTACRYTVRYGIASRWDYSSLATDQEGQDAAELPPSCPQDAGTNVVGSEQSEDCLFATIFAPLSATSESSLPVLVWFHGGSYVAGSASAPGLDGSTLASEGDLIIVIPQYRLGVLGYLPPTLAASSSDPNLGLRDIVLALEAVKEYIYFAGGDSEKVTIGGQSSGGGIVRALWAVPTAVGLYRAMIMQSDPITYGLAPLRITSELQVALYQGEPFANCSTLSCLENISATDIVAAQDTLAIAAPYEFAGVPLAEPIRPTYGTDTIPNEPTASLFYNPGALAISPSSIPLLLTTVSHEAGQTIEAMMPEPISPDNGTYYTYLAALLGSTRAEVVFNSGYYTINDEASEDALRDTLERVITDGAWRCAGRSAAEHWAMSGGTVWVGEWKQGVTYPDNDIEGGYCTGTGIVCHEDDIYPTFGTAPSTAPSNTSKLETEVSSYWISFITLLAPAPTGDASWAAYTSTSGDNNVLALGGDGIVLTCPGGGPGAFWGTAVQYDWELYD